VLFVDQVTIKVKAGNGGNGCQSHCRNRYSRYAKPDGGDGGRGGDVIIKAGQDLYTLLDFKYKSDFKADRGVHGSGNQRRGKDALPLIIKVPPGTVISDAQTGCVLRDLDIQGDSVVVAKGGSGGLGNRTKKEARPGSQGEEKELILDLKVIADVGLVGFPNAGKSTLISEVSSAHPKIAAYPFTTKSPVLGVVRQDEFNFVIADIPGLIEGSHKGKGLGGRFLRHVERTKLILHIIDIAATEGRSPVNDYMQINKELKLYGSQVLHKPQFIVANKMDLDSAQANLEEFKRKIKKQVYPISALEGTGLEELVGAISQRLQKNSN
jgi:GTP-binding protein